MYFVNRRGTEPYARWCERTAGETSPPTRYPNYGVSMMGEALGSLSQLFYRL